MTIDELNNKLQHYDLKCIGSGKTFFINSTISPYQLVAKIPVNDIAFHLIKPIYGNFSSKNVEALLIKFALTPPYKRISKYNTKMIINLIQIKTLLNKRYFPKSRALHYIHELINRLKVGD